MSPKSKKESKPEAKEKKASAKSESKPDSKKDAKAAAAPAAGQPGEAPVDPDELEEQEELAAASASSQSSNAAALAAASGGQEISASFKNFRHHPDMENFYRFIYENDLRHEALDIIDEIMVEKQNRKQMKHVKGQQAH